MFSFLFSRYYNNNNNNNNTQEKIDVSTETDPVQKEEEEFLIVDDPPCENTVEKEITNISKNNIISIYSCIEKEKKENIEKFLDIDDFVAYQKTKKYKNNKALARQQAKSRSSSYVKRK